MDIFNRPFTGAALWSCKPYWVCWAIVFWYLLWIITASCASTLANNIFEVWFKKQVLHSMAACESKWMMRTFWSTNVFPSSLPSKHCYTTHCHCEMIRKDIKQTVQDVDLDVRHDFLTWSGFIGLKSLPLLFCSQLGSSLGWGSSDVCETMDLCPVCVTAELSSTRPWHIHWKIAPWWTCQRDYLSRLTWSGSRKSLEMKCCSICCSVGEYSA